MIVNRIGQLVCGVTLLVSIAGVHAGDIQLDVQKRTLANGMRILVVENHSAPVFSSIIRFNTGAVDEHPGITGASHLLEHMLFKGTKMIGTSDYQAEVPIMAKIDSLAHLLYQAQVKLQSPLNPQDSSRVKQLKAEMASLQSEQKKYVIKDELWGTYLANGGSGLNASTGNDGTQYFLSLPKNRLELWAYLESDRLANLVLREFYSERDVVMEERRLRSENDPWGVIDEALSATVYWASPYGWPVVGWMSDLQTLQREDVEAYFKSHYSPANAVAVIVGDVKPDEVFAVCEKYLGKVPSQPLPPAVVTRDAPQSGERRVEVEYDANPIGIAAWRIPQIGDPDLPALEMIANILSSGRTSRFYKSIKDKRLGTVTAAADNNRYPGTFNCMITPYGDHSVKELEDAIYTEIDRLKTEPVTERELEKVRNQSDASFVRSLDSNNGLCFRLANSEVMTGDWNNFLKFRENLKKVSSADVMRVAGKYLTKKNRSVVYLVKASTSDKTSSSAN